MIRAGAIAALLLLAACHRSAAVSDAPDADADQRAKTAAKTTADLAAADEAARAPLPRRVAPPVVREQAEPAREAPADEPELADNSAD